MGPPPGASLSQAAVHLEAVGLVRSGRTVLGPLAATLPAGEKALVVGANGSGKTTLLAAISGLLHVAEGRVLTLGLDPRLERRRLHERLGHLGHRDPFYPELTGRENLVFHARLRGAARVAVDRALEASGLAADADRPVGTYSHGMRRRLGVEKALLGAPELVVLDEPDAGLDHAARRSLATRLAGLSGAVLLSSHHWEEHLDWARRVLVLDAGRLVYDGPADAGAVRGVLEAAR